MTVLQQLAHSPQIFVFLVDMAAMFQSSQSGFSDLQNRFTLSGELHRRSGFRIVNDGVSDYLDSLTAD